MNFFDHYFSHRYEVPGVGILDRDRPGNCGSFEQYLSSLVYDLQNFPEHEPKEDSFQLDLIIPIEEK